MIASTIIFTWALSHECTIFGFADAIPIFTINQALQNSGASFVPKLTGSKLLRPHVVLLRSTDITLIYRRRHSMVALSYCDLAICSKQASSALSRQSKALNCRANQSFALVGNRFPVTSREHLSSSAFPSLESGCST